MAFLRRLAALSLLTAALSGCAAARSRGPTLPDARIADADLSRAPSAVSARDAIVDLERAAYLFGEAYAGTEAGPTPAQLAAARAALAARSRWEPEALGRVILDAFGRPDAHLAIDHGGTSQLRTVAAPPAGTHGAAQGDAVELREGDVTVLAIRSFDNRHVGELSQLPALAERLRAAPAFVIDLRGNGGGNYAFAEAFVLALTDAELLRLGEREVVSVAAAEGRANAVRRQLARGQLPDLALPHYLRHLEALDSVVRSLRAEGHARTDVERAPMRMRGHAPGPPRGRGVVLVDEGCASACEMAVSLLRQVPGLVLAGRSTRGGMEVGEIAVFRLPRSGLVLQMGTRRFADPLGEFAETRGFAPTVALETAGLQALDDARGLARRGSGGSAVASRAR